MKIKNDLNCDGRFNQLVDGLNESAIVSIANIKGEITFTNDKFSEVSGYTKEELLGANHRIVNSGYHPKEFFKEMWDTISSGKTWQGEVCNRKKDGSLYWVSTVITRSRDEFGNPQYMSIRFDITKQKNIEKQLIHNAKLAYLGEMSACVAHEINNPLTVIHGVAKMLSRHENDAEKFKSNVNKISKSVERISRIVNSLKKISHGGSESKIYKNIDFAYIVKDVCSLVGIRMKENNVSLSLNLKDNILISCDKAEIEQVLINLLNNSIDAIKDNNEKWIKVELIENSDLAVLSIIDSGPGICEKKIDKLFDPFFTTKSIGEGTGLGLSICKGIIDSHNGSIRINPNIKNTCFELRFNKVVIKNVA